MLLPIVWRRCGHFVTMNGRKHRVGEYFCSRHAYAIRAGLLTKLSLISSPAQALHSHVVYAGYRRSHLLVEWAAPAWCRITDSGTNLGFAAPPAHLSEHREFAIFTSRPIRIMRHWRSWDEQCRHPVVLCHIRVR